MDCSDCSEGCGLIQRSDRRFLNFISPMTNPLFFEDPRNVTELRPIFLYNKVPGRAGGNSVRVVAMHLRAALTDRLSFVAAKDGFIMSSNPLIDDGWADVSVGLKYNLLADPCSQTLLSIGASCDLPVGTSRARQGNGDGEFHVYLTGGTEFAEDWHWVSATGFRLPVDSSSESQVWYWSNHVDRRLFGSVYALTELNWYHWMRSGRGGLPGVEGLDLLNLGSTGVTGNDIVTAALGFKVKPTELMEVGVAWEVPLTKRRDVLENRLTVDWIIRY